MGRHGKSLRAVVGEITRSGDRSTLFWWLVDHHDEIAQAADGRRLQWASLCERFEEAGLTDLNGKTPSPHTARITWQRARKMVAKARERQAAAAAQPKRVGATPPSRISKDWRPSGFRQPEQSSQQAQPTQPGTQLAVQSGFRSPLINDGRPPAPPPMTHEEQMEFLKGRGPRPPPLPQDAESQIRRLRGEMNLRSGRPYDDPGDYAAKQAEKNEPTRPSTSLFARRSPTITGPFAKRWRIIEEPEQAGMARETEMDGSIKVESERADGVGTGPRLLIRAGRGRTGASTGLDLALQRARHSGRRVKPLDGDLRSRTLSALYPPHAEDGTPIEDGASAPKSDELPDIKAWLSAELDAMIHTGVSRVLDLSGGDRVMQEYVRDLALMQFCRDFGIAVTVAVFLGPDPEDFRHATQLLTTGELECERTLLVLNEGVIRLGQSTTGAFDVIMAQPEFATLLKGGTRSMFIRRLSCMPMLREQGLRFYDLLDRFPNSIGASVSPTLQHMTKTWLLGFEQELAKNDVADWLP